MPTSTTACPILPESSGANARMTGESKVMSCAMLWALGVSTETNVSWVKSGFMMSTTLPAAAAADSPPLSSLPFIDATRFSGVTPRTPVYLRTWLAQYAQHTWLSCGCGSELGKSSNINSKSFLARRSKVTPIIAREGPDRRRLVPQPVQGLRRQIVGRGRSHACRAQDQRKEA